ncbi:MAG: GAF domain-containing protein [Candidatus Sulfotelmatobacter sp.]
MDMVSGWKVSASPSWARGRAENIVTDQEKKPVLDEQAFEKLLEAAYVLQEHNSRMQEVEEKMESQSARLREQEAANQAPPPAPPANQTKPEETSRTNGDYTLTLAEIVEAQRQIQMRRLELDKAMAVVAERVTRITGASGAAIAILEGGTVHYRAGTGAAALPVGSEAPLNTAVCAASLRTGQVIRSEDVNLEFLFDPAPCRQRGILSLVVVPVYREDEIMGALELYFDRVRGFVEQDIHTCQLMAGLVTEAIGRDAELALKKSMAAERSTMLAAIERLQPNLAAWAEVHPADVRPADNQAADDQAAANQPAATAGPNVSAATAAKSLCWKCGSKLPDEEQFCGKCGAPRARDAGPSSMQSQLASAWQMRPGRDPFALQEPEHEPGTDAASEEENAAYEFPEQFSLPEFEESNPFSTQSLAASAQEDSPSASPSPQPDENLDENSDENEVRPLSTAMVKQPDAIIWSSAARAREFLESLSATRTPTALARFWHSRRGDFYLAIAVILVLVVIRWGIWSSHSVGATGHGATVAGRANRSKQPAPDSDLSVFDKFLISLGLAEAPDAPEYKGNPYTQVWVDLQTALYYCPGSDLYEKTPKGKLTTQRDAQMDQFEPADRRACE